MAKQITAWDDDPAALRALPERTVRLLKAKGFRISRDNTRAALSDATVEIVWPAGDEDLELCFTTKTDATLYARPAGLLLAEEDK
jgi:hypothetical protein